MWSLKTSSFYLTGSRHLRPIRSRLFESEQVQHRANTIPTLFKFHSILCCCLCCFFQCLLPPAQEWTASQTGTKNNNELPWFLFEVTVMTLRGFLFVLQWFQRQKKKITTSCDFSSYFPFSVNVHCKIFISSVRLPGLPWEYALPRQSDHRPGHCQRLCVWRDRECVKWEQQQQQKKKWPSHKAKFTRFCHLPDREQSFLPLLLFTMWCKCDELIWLSLQTKCCITFFMTGWLVLQETF